MRNICYTLLLCFAALQLNAAPAVSDAAAEESLWNYASPAADGILYFNTKQAEKAMNKNLWEMIQRDKNAAIDSEPEEQLFDTKNRDVELIVNVYIRSVSPFSAAIEGVANITGNIHNDIQKLMGTLGQNGGPVPQMSKDEKNPRYNLSIPANENVPPVDIMFTPVNNNQLHFRINIVPKDRMSQYTVETSQAKSKLLTTVPQREHSFVLSANVEKISTLPMLQNDRSGMAAVYLDKVRTVCIYGHVQNLFLILRGDIVLKGPEFAGSFVQLLNVFNTNMSAKIKKDNLVQITSKSNIVTVSGKVNIADAWDAISKITRQPRSKKTSMTKQVRRKKTSITKQTKTKNSPAGN